MRARARFERLLSPGRIGSLELRNRILMTPMGSNLAHQDGHLGERIKRYYEARAEGGAGLLILGVAAVSWPEGACNPNQVAISDDRFLPGLADLARRVHRHGAKLAIQLQHAGKVAVRDIAAGRPMLVPSPTTPKAGDLMDDLTPGETTAFVADLLKEGAKIGFRVMTEEDIAELTRRFAEAADRAKRAGFDAVELHAGHGYLFSAFLSPASNRREDRYGGSLGNRARFLLETIHAVKQRVGAEFPVWCRIDAVEFRTEGGISFEDARRTAALAEAAGADAIHVSAYANPTSGFAFTEAPLVHRPCGYVGFAAGIKARVRVPVIAVGRIEPDEAETLLREGKADFVAMGRKLLADPELPRKLGELGPEAVRPCIYCYTCVTQIFLNAPLRCAVNPATGREAEFEIHRAPSPKRVLVVGGGPAGMEAARVAALRGHAVILCERSRRLGGTLLFSSLVCEVNGRLAEWLEAQIRHLGVEIRLGWEVTADRVEAIRPDTVLVAVGARRALPPIPGVDRPNVLSGDHLRSVLAGEAVGPASGGISAGRRMGLWAGRLLGVAGNLRRARALTRWWMPLGRRVAILGGGLVGVELAHFLADRGREVAVLEESRCFAAEMAIPRRWRTLHELRERGVSLLAEARVEEIEERGVRFATAGGEHRTLPCDSVILAVGARENRELGEAIAARGREVHFLGDCSGVGYIEGAILDAARVARSM